MDKLIKLLNEDYKIKTWLTKNYFWVGTIFVVLLCIFVYLSSVNNWKLVILERGEWTDGLNFRALFAGFENSFRHINLQHALLNMLCFLIVGIYLERKIGTIKLLLLVVAFAFLSTGIIAAMSGSVSSIGYSGVNYAFYFYIIIDFIFDIFQNSKMSKSSFIFGIIMIALIYLAMCFDGGTTGFGFAWYPWDLFNNMGHTGGAISGIIVALIIRIAPLGQRKQ